MSSSEWPKIPPDPQPKEPVLSENALERILGDLGTLKTTDKNFDMHFAEALDTYIPDASPEIIALYRQAVLKIEEDGRNRFRSALAKIDERAQAARTHPASAVQTRERGDRKFMPTSDPNKLDAMPLSVLRGFLDKKDTPNEHRDAIYEAWARRARASSPPGDRE